MTRRYVVVVMTALTVAVASGATAQSDFDRYVEGVRKAGMTESATSAIRTVASILSGGSAFKATRAPDGNVGRSYSSNLCFVPTKDAALLAKQRALRQQLQAKEDVWMRFLQERADVDGSGFVSTEEGQAMRSVVEMGLVAAQLGISGLDELARASYGDRAKAPADVAAYLRLLAAAKKQGLEGLPDLPVGLVERPADLESRPTGK